MVNHMTHKSHVKVISFTPTMLNIKGEEEGKLLVSFCTLIIHLISKEYLWFTLLLLRTFLGKTPQIGRV